MDSTTIPTAWSLVQREPYRVFFPLAAILGAAGVGHWLLYWWQVIPVFSALGHALVQVEAFLLAFACGFLMTMLPRRTGLPPASGLEFAGILVGLIALSVTALSGRFIASQVAFIAVTALLATFAGRRMMRGTSARRAPDAFVLVPLGLASGLAGSIFLLAGLAGGHERLGLLGRGLIVEGLFLCLVLGVGHLLWPMLAAAPPIPDGDGSKGSRSGRRNHALVGLAIIASFPLEHLLIARGAPELGASAGHLLRGGAFVIDWAACVRAWRWPLAPGLHRRFAWLAFWLVPLGEILAGLFPLRAVGLMHVTFVGGFSLLCFVIGAHVIAAHSGAAGIVSGRPWQVWGFALLFLVAMLTRVTADFLGGAAYWAHVGWAAALWMAGLALWLVWLLPRVVKTA